MVHLKRDIVHENAGIGECDGFCVMIGATQRCGDRANVGSKRGLNGELVFQSPFAPLRKTGMFVILNNCPL
jgi:hypothetical protein